MSESLQNSLDEDFLSRLRSFRLFKETHDLGEDHLRQLLRQGRFERHSPGARLIAFNEPGRYLYWLVKGELDVYATAGDNDGEEHRVAHLTPGEFFGEMTLLTNETTSAEVRVTAKSKDAVTFKIAFDAMLSLSDHSVLSLPVKIVLYRQIVHLLRWRNDLYRIRFAGHELAQSAYTVPPFSGLNWTSDELRSLYAQAASLATRLKELNQKLGSGLPKAHKAG